MKIDASKSAVENLIAQVIADNVGKTLTAAQFTLGTPTVDGAGVGGRNTQLVLTATAAQPFVGTKLLKYTRLALDTGTVTPVTSVDVVLADDQAASLAKVITALGLVASEVDASGYEAPTSDADDGLITLTPKVGSILYVGAPISVLLHLPSIQTFDEVFPVGDLSGFEPA